MSQETLFTHDFPTFSVKELKSSVLNLILTYLSVCGGPSHWIRLIVGSCALPASLHDVSSPSKLLGVCTNDQVCCHSLSYKITRRLSFLPHHHARDRRGERSRGSEQQKKRKNQRLGNKVRQEFSKTSEMYQFFHVILSKSLRLPGFGTPSQHSVSCRSDRGERFWSEGCRATLPRQCESGSESCVGE